MVDQETSRQNKENIDPRRTSAPRDCSPRLEEDNRGSNLQMNVKRHPEKRADSTTKAHQTIDRRTSSSRRPCISSRISRWRQMMSRLSLLAPSTLSAQPIDSKRSWTLRPRIRTWNRKPHSRSKQSIPPLERRTAPGSSLVSEQLHASLQALTAVDAQAHQAQRAPKVDEQTLAWVKRR